jgi:hypothetical protein
LRKATAVCDCLHSRRLGLEISFSHHLVLISGLSPGDHKSPAPLHGGAGLSCVWCFRGGEDFHFLPQPFSLEQLAVAVKETLGR